jgi:hypothetical protein
MPRRRVIEPTTSAAAMSWEIAPYIGVGPIRFGMSPEEIRRTLGSPVRPSQKSASTIPADFFTELGIFVDYAPPGLCQAAEFAGPASPTFCGQRLLGRPYAGAERWLASLDPDVRRHDAGLHSDLFGIGLYASAPHKSPADPIEGVIVFARGYYDVTCKSAP